MKLKLPTFNISYKVAEIVKTNNIKPTIEYLQSVRAEREIQNQIDKKEQERIELAFSLGICPECGSDKIRKSSTIGMAHVWHNYKCKECKFKHSKRFY